jgi:hypothetical protein
MAGGDWRIELTRSGGFAGLGRSVSLSPHDLDDGEATEIEHLLDGIDARALQARGALGPGRPDGFQYDLTVERGGDTHRFTVRDGAIPPEVEPLIERLSERLRAG